jgi:hypothetical protein
MVRVGHNTACVAVLCLIRIVRTGNAAKGFAMSYVGGGFGGLTSGTSALVGHYGVAELSDDQLRRIAPSIFAEDRHESRSDRYTFIPTSEIVAGMRQQGMVPVEARQGRCRTADKQDFTKHMIRFRPAGEPVALRQIGGLYPEVVLINSHDGTSRYKLMAGLLRLLCLNGMLTSDRELSNVSIPHKGDIVSNVIEGSFTVIEESRRAIEQADSWAGIELSRDERQVFAESAHILRFADSEGEVTTHITPDALLVPRRYEDRGNDLFRTVNVVQENAIRGGLHGVGRGSDGRTRRSTSRPVTAIDGDIKINRALWLLGERMAELKSAA